MELVRRQPSPINSSEQKLTLGAQTLCAFIIAVATIFGAGSANAADPIITPRHPTHWLIKQFESTSLLNEINLDQIRTLRKCACFELGKAGVENHPSRTKNCTRDELEQEPVFVSRVVNIYGDIREEQVACSVILKRLVKDRIERDFPKMIEALVQMKPQLRDSNPRLSETIQPNLTTAITVRPRHPLNMSALVRDIELAEIPALDPKLLKTHASSYFTSSFGYCQQYMTSSRALQLSKQIVEETKSRAPFDAKELCRALIGAPTKQTKTFRSVVSRSVAFATLAEDYYATAAAWREAVYRPEKHAQYLETINRNPIVMLVSSPQPTTDEIAAALRVLEANATDRVNLDKSVRSRLGSLLDASVVPQASAIGALESELLSYAGFEVAFDYTTAFLTKAGWSDEEILHAQDLYTQRHQREQLMRTVAEIAIQLGSQTLCLLPVGKPIGLVFSVAAKSLCFTSIGLAVNTYFAFDAFRIYSSTLKLALSHVETTKSLKTFEEVQSSTLPVILSSALLPVGLGLKTSREAVVAILRASSR